MSAAGWVLKCFSVARSHERNNGDSLPPARVFPAHPRHHRGAFLPSAQGFFHEGRGWSGYTTQPFRLLVKCMTTPSCHDHPFHDVDGEAWHGCGSTSPAAPRVAGAQFAHLIEVGSAAGITVEIVGNNIVSQVTIYGVGRRVGFKVFLRCPLT